MGSHVGATEIMEYGDNGCSRNKWSFVSSLRILQELKQKSNKELRQRSWSQQDNGKFYKTDELQLVQLCNSNHIPYCVNLQVHIDITVTAISTIPEALLQVSISRNEIIERENTFNYSRVSGINIAAIKITVATYQAEKMYSKINKTCGNPNDGSLYMMLYRERTRIHIF